MKSAGLYLHIPYCVKKCAYCDFVSFPSAEGVPTDYCAAVLTEIALTAEALPEREYATLFFGGGTPSLLSGAQMTELLRALRLHFRIRPDAEITVECNPGTVTEEKLAAYRAAGVNRVSVGLQSSDDGLLRTLGRIHDFAAFEDTVRLLRQTGFKNFNVDVMHGLPGQTEAQYLDALRRAMDSGATHISAYGLILEEGTPLYRAVRAGRALLPEEDETADMQDAGIDLLEQNGFARYEISNFARAGFCCRHNLNYWANGEYVGLGLAAHSAMRQDGWTRWSNTEQPRTYLARLQAQRRPLAETMRLPPIEEMFETVMLGLRTVRGVSLAEFQARFGAALPDVYGEAVGELRDRDWLDESALAAGFLALNRRGLDLQNAALQYFLS